MAACPNCAGLTRRIVELSTLIDEATALLDSHHFRWPDGKPVGLKESQAYRVSW